MPTVMINGEEHHVDGFISQICLPDGKKYALQCSVIAVKPITCPKCGGAVELKYGEGKCVFCGTQFTSKFEMVEKNAIEESDKND